jgi:AcrR family transcriptional regulator
MMFSAQERRVNKALIATMVDEGRVTDPARPKGKLLAAAARLFRQRGYAQTTVRDLAAEVNILSGSIFHHFKSKDDILFTVMHDVVVAMTEALKLRLQDAHTPEHQLRALIHNELSFIHGLSGDATAVLVHEWRSLSKARQKEIMKMRSTYERLWLDVFKVANKENHLLGDPVVARQLLHGGLVWSVYWFRPKGKFDLEQLTEQALSMIYRK